ncbi:hypothetical protein HC762_00710 [bacterium]|nr:hypothetical protein [bacterium]
MLGDSVAVDEETEAGAAIMKSSGAVQRSVRAVEIFVAALLVQLVQLIVAIDRFSVSPFSSFIEVAERQETKILGARSRDHLRHVGLGRKLGSDCYY